MKSTCQKKAFTKKTIILSAYIFNCYSCMFKGLLLLYMVDIKQWRKNKENQKKAFCKNHPIQGYIEVFWYLDICIICKLRTESDHSMTQNDKTFTEKKVIFKKTQKIHLMENYKFNLLYCYKIIHI